MVTASPALCGGGTTSATVTSSQCSRSCFCVGAITTPLPSKTSPSTLHDAGYRKQKPPSGWQYLFEGSGLGVGFGAVCDTAIVERPSDTTSKTHIRKRTCILLDLHGTLAVSNGL